MSDKLTAADFAAVDLTGAYWATGDVLKAAVLRQHRRCTLCSQVLEFDAAILGLLCVGGVFYPAAVHAECSAAGDMMRSIGEVQVWAADLYPDDPEIRARIGNTVRRVVLAASRPEPPPEPEPKPEPDAPAKPKAQPAGMAELLAPALGQVPETPGGGG